MATASTQEYDTARQINNITLQSLNLKLDNNFDEYVLSIVGIDDQHLSESLPSIINEHSIKWFNDIEEFLIFIHSIQNKLIFIIISGKLGKDHAQKFLFEKQIVGLYVYCRAEDKHRMWTKGIKKIRCTVSDATKLLNQLHRDIKELSGRWPIDLISFQKSTTFASEWYHLFLLAICHRPEAIKESYKEMFNECRAYYHKNPGMIKQIDRFQQIYKSDNAIQEYTRDSFLYRIVNHALRTKNMEIIRKFSPFIRDLHSQLHNSHREYCKSKNDYIRVVYRGQHLSEDEIEYLRLVSKSNKPIVTMTTFSSSSLDPDVALDFASPVDGRIPCLFEIIIPDNYNADEENMPRYEQVFTNIASVSVIPDEQEVLFSLVTRFSVEHVGYPVNQSGRTWVPIVLKLTTAKEGGSYYNHFDIIIRIENETDQQIYTDILHMIQVIAEDEFQFQSINWQNWWNNLKRPSSQNLIPKLPLHLMFYDCFTENKYWSRKAIELYKEILSSTRSSMWNSLSFPELFRELKIWHHNPNIQIAIYEDYLKRLCIENTKEVVECLRLAGDNYKKTDDKKCALECYRAALNMNVNDKYRMNNMIQKQIEKLEKPSKTTDNSERRSVKQDSNQESSEIYEAQQDLRLLYEIIKSTVPNKFPIQKRLVRIYDFLRRRESWYDMADAKIILRLPYEDTEDLSVNDYRYKLFSAVNIHISSRNSATDAANNHSLSLWRYTKYMDEWMLCKELETFLQPFQSKSYLIRCSILPQLERLIKKLHVLITICTIYVSIKVGQEHVNVNNVQFINQTNPQMKHSIHVDLQNSDLLTDLILFEDKHLTTGETTNSIPDHIRLISGPYTDFMQE